MTGKSARIILLVVAVAAALGACAIWYRQPPDVQAALAVTRAPRIRPDYSGIMIPPNIAPLNFSIREQGTRFFVRVASEAGDSIEIVSRSPKIRIPANRWRSLLEANRGKKLQFVVYAKQDQQWHRYDPIDNRIAEEEIDGYLAYRLIDPVHVTSHKVAVVQRNLATDHESVVLDGMSFDTGCVNCHSFANNDPKRMLIGTRSDKFGNASLLVADGQVKKIGARFGYTAWHPGGQAAVYSINKVRQFFHSAGAEGRDVIDMDAALAYYLVETGNVKMVPRASDKRRLETYPTWSPDGRYLYYCSAPILWEDNRQVPPPRYADVKYDLMRIGYDQASDEWGTPELVLSAQETNLSILLPRISPDGRFLLFCMCERGGFPVYQPSSDLYMMDLGTGEYSKPTINSDFSESWHSWSSNGRWIAFSSKRRQRPFTRCYLSYVDQTGKAHKPFILPQSDPEFYDSFLKTVSVPELITGPVPITGEALAGAVRSDRAITVDAISGASRPTDAAQSSQPVRE
jgi:Tol biopolymer transport system component